MKMRAKSSVAALLRPVVLLALFCVLATPLSAQEDRYQGDQIEPGAVVELEEARAMRKAGDYEAAIERLSVLVEEEPDYYLAWYNLGLAQAQSRQLDGGVESLSKALELKERLDIPDGTIYNSLGWTHYLRGDYQAAKPVLERAVEQEDLSDRSKTRALNNLGSVLLRLRQYDAAEKTLGEATTMGSARAKTNLQVLSATRSMSIKKEMEQEERESEGGGGSEED